MKMKRVLSLLLALVMCLAMAAPTFAAEPEDPNEGIMPLIQIYPDHMISDLGSYSSGSFRANPGAGNYIQIWYENQADAPVRVYLYRTDKSGSVGPILVNKDSNARGVYYDATAESGTYYVYIQAENNGQIHGRLAVGQYVNYPAY